MAVGLLLLRIAECAGALESEVADGEVAYLVRLLALCTDGTARQLVTARAPLDADDIGGAHLQQVLDVAVGILKHQVTDIHRPLLATSDELSPLPITRRCLLDRLRLRRDVVTLHCRQSRERVARHRAYDDIITVDCHISSIFIIQLPYPHVTSSPRPVRCVYRFSATQICSPLT